MGRQFGRYPWGQELWGGLAADTAPTDMTSRRWYTIEVQDPDDLTLMRLPNWGSGHWTQRVCRAPELEITYPLDDPAVEHLVAPNQVVLIDEAGEIIDRFVIASRTRRCSADGYPYVSVHCYGTMALLGRGQGLNYSTTAATSVAEILEALLAEQETTVYQPITLGTVAAAIGGLSRTLTTENGNILGALDDLWRTVGGYYEVDAQRRLNWRRYLIGTPGQEIRRSKNLGDLAITEDWWSIRTRVIAYGRGKTDEARLKATVDADNQGTYGVVTEVVDDTTIWDESQLASMAASTLADVSTPAKRYAVGMIDLSQLSGDIDYSHEVLRLGARVRVIDESLDEAIETTIVAIDRDLAEPARIKIEVSDPDAGVEAWGGNAPTRSTDVADLLADVLDRLDDVTIRDDGTFRSLRDLIDPELDDLSDLIHHSLDTHAGNLDEALEDVLGAIEDIVTWDLDTHAGNLDEALEDVLDEGIIAETVADAIEGAIQTDEGVQSQIAGIVEDSASDATPKAVAATGAAGTSTALTRDDHVHACSRYNTAIPSPSSATPQAVAAAGAAGTSADYSRADHVHAGPAWYTAATAAALGTPTLDYALGFSTSDKHSWIWDDDNGRWLGLDTLDAVTPS